MSLIAFHRVEQFASFLASHLAGKALIVGSPPILISATFGCIGGWPAFGGD